MFSWGGKWGYISFKRKTVIHLVEKEKLEYIYLRWKMERRLSEKENGDKHYMNDRMVVWGGGGGGEGNWRMGMKCGVGWGGWGRVRLDGGIERTVILSFYVRFPSTPSPSLHHLRNHLAYSCNFSLSDTPPTTPPPNPPPPPPSPSSFPLLPLPPKQLRRQQHQTVTLAQSSTPIRAPKGLWRK